jgi:hypothetical protein
LALGDEGFGSKQLAEHSIAKILGTTTATLWLMALARNVGGSKIPVKRQGTNGQAHLIHLTSVSIFHRQVCDVWCHN